MADGGSDPPGFRLDISQILLEVQHRWLRPAEISEILRNYQKFHITPEPPFRPVSGSVFLFDRKVLRYFRKDGHNWRKKKDGKTIREAHEKLKVGSVDVLHCYYAHGEESDNFQRRCYWMLEEDLMHIVFVHYLEVKGNKASISYTRSTQPEQSHSLDESSSAISAHADSTSPTSTLTLAHEEAESVDCTFIPSRDGGGNCTDGSLTSGLQSNMDLGSWEEVLEHCTRGADLYKQNFQNASPVQANWQYSFADSPMQFQGQPVNQSLIMDSSYDFGNSSLDTTSLPSNLQVNLQNLSSHLELLGDVNQEDTMNILGDEDYSTVKQQPRFGSILKEEGLNKVDSFSRWAAKELEDVEELHVHSSNGISWTVIDDTEDDGSCIPRELQLDSHSLNPSLSQVQLFSITDFSPNWAYSACETKVLITGKFLKREREVAECRWSCMFGEVEVAVEVLTDSLLRCYAPPHKPGAVPFYVTCSNRLACSEVREFEYRVGPCQEIDAADMLMTEMHLLERFQSLLSANSHYYHSCDNPTSAKEKENRINKIMCLLEEENLQIVERVSACEMSRPRVMEDLLIENQLKERFYAWLVHQVTSDGKRQSVVDGEGQGMLHVAAALGYDWALKPILASGVSIDFRDINGWTALHWAALHGREKTVVHLVSLGASAGALTDPSAEFPLGRTPADLASGNGHKGISGFLAESSLTKHLLTLTVDDDNAAESSGAKLVETASPTIGDDVADVLSLKDSLEAVRNATQAATRIHQIFRVQSFQRKQILEHCNDEDERALSVIAAKASRLGQNDGVAHSAALRIQKKFRGWKKRKEFLLIRQRIVKIQALVRGHQVRKKYKPIIWSVGILEKVILRWRRKGSGLRGFRSEEVTNRQSPQDQYPLLEVEDDYDFLKEGRKQTEVRMQKALARVKSMAQYPEARAQYRRLLTAAERLRETKQDGRRTGIPQSVEDDSYHEEDLFYVEDLLDDDTFMSMAFE